MREDTSWWSACVCCWSSWRLSTRTMRNHSTIIKRVTNVGPTEMPLGACLHLLWMRLAAVGRRGGNTTSGSISTAIAGCLSRDEGIASPESSGHFWSCRYGQIRPVYILRWGGVVYCTLTTLVTAARAGLPLGGVPGSVFDPAMNSSIARTARCASQSVQTVCIPPSCACCAGRRSSNLRKQR